jgi:hypothetical protein
LDECEVLTGWSSSQTLLLNKVDKQQNTACIEFTGSTTEEFKKVFSPAFDSGTNQANGALRFWYYVSDVTKCGPIRVEIGSAGVADVHEYSWQLTGMVNGWNKVDLKMSSATKVGTPNLNAINWFRIYDSKSGSITTRIDGIEVYNTALSSINELKMNDLEVSAYPNPVQNQLNIRLANSNRGYLNLTLFDSNGKVIITKTENQNNNSDYQFDVSNLNTGLYLLKITSDGKTTTKKINRTR